MINKSIDLSKSAWDTSFQPTVAPPFGKSPYPVCNAAQENSPSLEFKNLTH